MQDEPYATRLLRWPREAQHILAHDDEHVVVYQASKHAIADHVLARQRFGGDFSFKRMIGLAAWPAHHGPLAQPA